MEGKEERGDAPRCCRGVGGAMRSCTALTRGLKALLPLWHLGLSPHPKCHHYEALWILWAAGQTVHGPSTPTIALNPVPNFFFHKEPWLTELLCNTEHPCSLGNYSRAPRASLAQPLAGFLSSRSPGQCLSHPGMLQLCTPEGRNGAGRFSHLPQHTHTTKAQLMPVHLRRCRGRIFPPRCWEGTRTPSGGPRRSQSHRR